MFCTEWGFDSSDMSAPPQIGSSGGDCLPWAAGQASESYHPAKYGAARKQWSGGSMSGRGLRVLATSYYQTGTGASKLYHLRELSSTTWSSKSRNLQTENKYFQISIIFQSRRPHSSTIWTERQLSAIDKLINIVNLTKKTAMFSLLFFGCCKTNVSKYQCRTIICTS